MLPGTITAAHRTTPRAALAKALPPALPVGDEFFVASILTLPHTDLAGDIVDPEGLSWDRHRLNPYVDFEHGRHPDVGSVPVGWARKSLARPSNDYCVFKCRLPDGIETWAGGTYFDRDDALQRQVCFGVRDGQWPGVSLEFLPDWSVAKSLGKSPLEARDAYRFGKASVVRWTHCAEPVCPGAVSVLKSLPHELEPLVRTLRDGRIRGEKLHPVIAKSLARYTPATTLVPVGKAMDPTDDPQTAYDPDLPEVGGDEVPAKPTAQAHYNVAQGIIDLIEQAKSDLVTSEHVKGKKFLLAKLEKLEAEAETIKGMGDKIDGETADDEPAAPVTPADDTDDEAGEVAEGTDLEGDDDTDMEVDEDGTFKAVRQVYKPVLKAVRAQRYSLADIRKGVADAARAAKPAADDPEMKAAREAFERATKKFNRNLKLYAPTN